MAKHIDSIKHNHDKRIHIPSKEEAGYEAAKQSTKQKVEKTLKIEIDDEAFDRLYGHISHPIEITKKNQKIAVRMISQFGEESTKVISIS